MPIMKVITIGDPPTVRVVWYPPTDVSSLEIGISFNQEKADENSDNNNKKPPGKTGKIDYVPDPSIHIHGIC